MRIASLLPSATEIVCNLGLQHALIGVSHECDTPADVVARLPRLTRTSVPLHLTSRQIDDFVKDKVARKEPLYQIEEDVLSALKPDLIITQAVCDVCAVSHAEACNLAARLPNQPPVISLNPTSLAGIYADIAAVAAATGTISQANLLTSSLRARSERVQTAVHGRPRPAVFACEWLDPPFAAGHWVPEMVALAGGREVLGRAGLPSERVTWEAVIAAAPEYILLMPCGFSERETAAAWEQLPRPHGWDSIPAAQPGRVVCLDANSFYSRPAPRFIDGIEQIAGIIHAGAQLASRTPEQSTPA